MGFPRALSEPSQPPSNTASTLEGGPMPTGWETPRKLDDDGSEGRLYFVNHNKRELLGTIRDMEYWRRGRKSRERTESNQRCGWRTGLRVGGSALLITMRRGRLGMIRGLKQSLFVCCSLSISKGCGFDSYWILRLRSYRQ
jgi:hypothetical protein